MELMMSYPVQECSLMETGNGTLNLTKSQIIRRRKALKRKLNANLASLEKPEDTENPNKMSTSSPAVQECSLMENDNGTLNLTKSQIIRRRKALKRKLNANLGLLEKREDTENPNQLSMSSPTGTGDGKSSKSKGEEQTEVANGEMGSSMTTNVNGEVKVQKKMETTICEMGSGTNAASKRRRKKKKMKNKNPDLDDILSNHERTHEGLGMLKVPGVTCNETVLEKTTTLDADMVSKEQGHTEVANGKTGVSETTTLNLNGDENWKIKLKSKNKRPTLGEILNPQYFQSLEAAKGEMGSSTSSTDNTASKKQRKQELNNIPDLADILSTRENAHVGLSTTKVLEVKSGEMVSGKTAIPDAKMVSEDHTEEASGKIEESEVTDINVNDKNKNKRRSKLKNKQPTLGELLSPQYLRNLEASKGEEGSGTTSTDNPVSKKRKRQKLNKNSNLGAVLSTRVSTQEGLTATKILEVNCCETVLDKTATSDANMVSKEDHTEVANDKRQENTTNNLNVNGKEKRNKGPTLCENLKLNTNSNLGGVLSTRDSTQEGLSTTKVPEVKSGETVSAKTAVPDTNMLSKGDRTEIGNGKTGESETTNLKVSEKNKRKKKSKSKNKQPTLGEVLSPQYLQNLDASKGEEGSGATSTDKESTQEGLSTTKVLEVKSGEMVSAKTAAPDANMLSKGDPTEIGNGKMGESETTNLKVNDKKKRKKKSKNKQPTLGEVLSPQYLQNLDASKGEEGSGATSTDNPVSKKQKRQKLNKNSDLGAVLSTRESMHEGLSAIEILEVNCRETVSDKTATSDANMVSREDHTEVANDKMQENRTNNLNVNGKKKKNKRPTLGENLNPQNLQNLEAANHEKGSESTISKGIVCPQVADSEMGSINIVLESAKPADQEGTEANANKALAIKSQRMRIKEITQVAALGKKLIILDVNGLLADVVSGRPKDMRADKYIPRQSIFKRPYLDDFLRFCFERFHVAIWSSRFMRNLKLAVDFLLGDLKKKLLFLWDGCRCTDSGIGTLEVKHKHVVVKDLRKIWDEDGPNKSWVKGTFHESNTLLVDDSPYKALLNPKHTGIFPASYSYKNRDDNFLGPKGELQTFLEGLAAADDVKTYVEQHPFGQRAIDEQSPHWAFYSSILERFNDKNIMESINEKNKKKRRCCKI